MTEAHEPDLADIRGPDVIHRLRQVDHQVRESTNRAEVLLHCPGGDLRVLFIISPANQAGRFAEAVAQAHMRQVGQRF